MKKLLMILSVVTGITFIASAQTVQKSPAQRAAHLTKLLQKQLHLNPTQATQINAAFYARATLMDSLKNNQSANKRANHSVRKNIIMTAQQQIMYVLNGQQKQQFLQWEKARKEKAMERKNPVGAVQS